MLCFKRGHSQVSLEGKQAQGGLRANQYSLESEGPGWSSAVGASPHTWAGHRPQQSVPIQLSLSL